MITQEQLKNELFYNQETGIFTWNKKSRKGGFAAGRECSSVDAHGYIQINILGKVHKAHRLAWLYMAGEHPAGQIDHINHDRKDNRFVNLRVVTNMDNNKNKPIQKNNTSGFVGVTLFKRINKWRAYIVVLDKQIHLGYFEKIEDAIKARIEANIKYGFHENHGATSTFKRMYRELQQLERKAA